MKLTINLTCIIFLLFGQACQENTLKTDPLKDEKIELLEEKLHDVLSTKYAVNDNEGSELWSTFLHILRDLKRNDFISYKKYCSELKKHSFLEIEGINFKDKMSFNEGAFVLDKLIYKFRLSNYCNSDYRFEEVQILPLDLRPTYKQGEIDSICLLTVGKQDGIRPAYILCNIDSIKNVSFLKKQNLNFSNYLKIDSKTKGFKQLEGAYFVDNPNKNLQYVPFSFKYEVK